MTKREREARRRRMLVEQQATATEAEKRAEAEALLATLARQSAQEQQLAERLWQLGQEQEVRARTCGAPVCAWHACMKSVCFLGWAGPSFVCSRMHGCV